MAPKRKHVALSISDKVNLLRKLDSGASVKKLCEEYNLGTSTIYDVKKQKEKLLKAFAESDRPDFMAKRKTLHSSKCVDLDKVLFEWIKQRRSEKFPLDRNIIIAQAKMFHEQLNVTVPCEYSTGWYNKFKIRHGLKLVKVCGEQNSADVEAAENFVEEFTEMVHIEKLTPDQIYNADESALFWRYIPRKTYVVSGETSVSGFKDSRDRLTVLACANAAGTHKSKLLIIGKSKKPRALKNVKVYPVHYQHNKRAWMTSDIFRNWYENIFVKDARLHCKNIGLPDDCKIVLLLDNCTAHTYSGIETKDNIFIHYLPPNCTSLIQPMDQGVLRALKCNYKTQFLKQMLHACNNGVSPVEFQKEYNIKDAMWKLSDAWKALKKETISHSWHKIWPPSIFFEEDSTSGKDDFKGFNISKEKLLIAELLDFAKESVSSKFLDEEAIEQCFETEENAPIVHKLTDQEIVDLVLETENKGHESESDSDDSDEMTPNVSIDVCMSMTKGLINVLEKKNFISEEHILNLYKIQEVLQKEKHSKMKQTKITDIFKINVE